MWVFFLGFIVEKSQSFLFTAGSSCYHCWLRNCQKAENGEKLFRNSVRDKKPKIRHNWKSDKNEKLKKNFFDIFLTLFGSLVGCDMAKKGLFSKLPPPPKPLPPTRGCWGWIFCGCCAPSPKLAGICMPPILLGINPCCWSKGLTGLLGTVGLLGFWLNNAMMESFDIVFFSSGTAAEGVEALPRSLKSSKKWLLLLSFVVVAGVPFVLVEVVVDCDGVAALTKSSNSESFWLVSPKKWNSK